MTDSIENNTTTTLIVGHEFAGDKCKVYVQAPTEAQLTSPETKKAVYEYRHTVGASHMGLNKFEPSERVTDSDGVSKASGYWYLMAGL